MLLLHAAAAAAVAAVPFEATFSGVEMIGSSNTTHFWMPTPLTRASAAPDSPLRTIVDLCGDGSVCPLPGHPPQQHEAYFTEPNGRAGRPWGPSQNGLGCTNGVIRLNQTVSRGLGGIALNTSTNTTATVQFQDWAFDSASSATHKSKYGAAPVTGLPPMLQIRYFAGGPSAILRTADGRQVALAQFYGILATAPAIGGCHGDCKPRNSTHGCVKMCFSVITIASSDQGASWEFRSAISWDSKVMPSAVEGPCESALVTMPDGLTLLSVFRIEDYTNLWAVTSSDQGRTWSTATEIDAWAVFPQLRALPSGALVLTSGRPGIGLWLADGRATGAATEAPPRSWKYYNLAQQHNALWPGSASSAGHADLLFLAPELAVVNAASKPSIPMLTKAYTGLTTTGCEEGGDNNTMACNLVVSYDRLANGNDGPDPPGPHGSVDAAFTMRVTVKAL
jgi:hypothetical protein